MPFSDTPLGTGSRRDEHKRRTRRALRDAALKLFAAKGYDTTTADDIAAEVGVSVRTFFRYFPTKENVLFFGQRAWLQSVAELCRSQPASMSGLEAMGATLIKAASDVERKRRALRLFERAVASSPTLRGISRDQQELHVTMMSEAIAARRGLSHADRVSILTASVGVSVYRRALDTWLAGPADIPFGEVVAEEFGLLAEVFSETEAQDPLLRERITAAGGGR
jgi:AcrR family transcriptional regulator